VEEIVGECMSECVSESALGESVCVSVSEFSVMSVQLEFTVLQSDIKTAATCGTKSPEYGLWTVLRNLNRIQCSTLSSTT
jgi:hypothetical protein